MQITSRSSYAPGVGLVKLEYLKVDPRDTESRPDPEFRKFNLDLIEVGQD